MKGAHSLVLLSQMFATSVCPKETKNEYLSHRELITTPNQNYVARTQGAAANYQDYYVFLAVFMIRLHGH